MWLARSLVSPGLVFLGALFAVNADTEIYTKNRFSPKSQVKMRNFVPMCNLSIEEYSLPSMCNILFLIFLSHLWLFLVLSPGFSVSATRIPAGFYCDSYIIVLFQKTKL